MTEVTLPAVGEGPAWLTREMPPGYQNRLFEIQRLSAELRSMERVGRVLWESGDPLKDAVAALLGAFECEVDAAAGAGPIAVKLGASRRLLLLVSKTASAIEKTSEELGRAFQAVQFASADDRVVLVANNDTTTPPSDRPDAILPDALEVLGRMGVNVVTAATLFRLWRLSFEDRSKARRVLDMLHEQDGGPFVLTGR